MRLPASGYLRLPICLKKRLVRKRRSLHKNRSFSVLIPKNRKKKRTARVLCVDSKQFWTTQNQFWKWVREGVIVKSHDYPLTGHFVKDLEDTAVLISNTVLNLACPNHLREALLARKQGGSKNR